MIIALMLVTYLFMIFDCNASECKNVEHELTLEQIFQQKLVESAMKRLEDTKYKDTPYCNDNNKLMQACANHEISLDEIRKELEVQKSLKFDLEQQDAYGHTALHIAAFAGRLDVVKILHNQGANLMAVNKRGATPCVVAHINACNLREKAQNALDKAQFIDADVNELTREAEQSQVQAQNYETIYKYLKNAYKAQKRRKNK